MHGSKVEASELPNIKPGSVFYMPVDLVFHCSSCSSKLGLLAETGYFPDKKEFTPKKEIRGKKKQ